MSRSRWAATVAGIAVSTGVTACSDGDAAETGSAADPVSSSPTVGEAEALASYDDVEVDAYREAVAALERNLRVGLKVYRKGEATPAARRALESIYTGDELGDEWESLRDMEADGGYLRGSAEVAWTRPVRVLVGDGEGTVDLRACVDRRDVRAYQADGEEITSPETSDKAAFVVTVDIGSDGIWRVSGGEETGTC